MILGGISLFSVASPSAQLFIWISLIQNHTPCPCPQDIDSSGWATSPELPFPVTAGLARRIIVIPVSRPPTEGATHLPIAAARSVDIDKFSITDPYCYSGEEKTHKTPLSGTSKLLQVKRHRIASRPLPGHCFCRQPSLANLGSGALGPCSIGRRRPAPEPIAG